MKYLELILKTGCTSTILLLIFFTSSHFAFSQAPTHTAKFSPQIDDNVNGFWEYLPRDYNTDTDQRYPLLVFIHGAGALGSTQDLATISKVLQNGTPKLIADNQFPESFTLNNQTYRFVVMSPQLKQGITGTTSTIQPSTIDAVIRYAQATYRIDPGRIYVAGVSMGGGATWDYAGSSRSVAQKIAGIAVACGAGDVSSTEANNIAAANLPVIAAHNYGDDIIEISRTINNVDLINDYTPAINPAPKTVYWNTPGANGEQHNVWSRMYEDILPGTTEGGNLRDTLGLNLYQWLLQYARTAEALPVVWKSFDLTQNDKAIWLSWKVSNQKNVRSFFVERSADGRSWSKLATIEPKTSNTDLISYTYTDQNPLNGDNFYRIKQTDHDGRASYSAAKKIAFSSLMNNQVRLFPNPFKTQITITIPDIEEKTVIAQLFDGSGKLIHSYNYAVQGNRSVVLNNLERLNNGSYHILVKGQSGKILYRSTLVKN